MLFNSLDFILFFPIVWLLYRITPQRFKWIVLLVASYYFYMSWKVEYALLIILSTVVDYYAALAIEKYHHRKKLWVSLSLVTNLGLLFFFKYFNFLADSFNEVFLLSGWALKIPYHDFLLPVGISFYTFQTLSYTLDVYKGKQKAERHFGIFALFVSFFPQLVAGPIERSGRLLPQFKEKRKIQYADLADGFKQVVWGYFKKVVIADRLALFVNHVYAQPEATPGIPLIIATFFFAIQIYCDFSGYSDIAIGTARMMGYELMENFKKPYFSKSIGEFWQRWHISLSTWFRDYVYIPLGGNRVSKSRWIANIMITFTVSGLWHGANWTFVVWGFLNGLYLVLGRETQKIRDSWFKSVPYGLRASAATLLTFSLTFIAWIFFRAENLTDAWFILTHLTSNPGYIFLLPTDLITERSFLFRMGLDGYEFWVAIMSLIIFHIIEWFSRKQTIYDFTRKWPTVFKWSFFYLLIFATLMFGEFNQQEFIYFQF